MKKRTETAFTLVELLVVIAVLVLLLTLLTPFMGRARQIAFRAVCASNIQNIGAAGMTFAAQHSGRGPGHAIRGRPGIDPPWHGDSSVAWCDILNVECYGDSRIQRMGYTPRKNRLYCPNMKYWGSLYPRGYYWNRDATGGPTWGGNPVEGPYGLDIDPAPLRNMYARFIYGSLNGYALGVRMFLFRSPSTQYLLLEAEAGNDVFGAMTGTIQMGNPSWVGKPSGGGYGFAYRHVLPMDTDLYRAQATGNFLFVDGHVEIHTPLETINTLDRFAISG
ncbi:MAG TPA: prepilin-type N-terminal cleavage/methylation domain-containing protein [Phycisphaerae bacterium]|nr:prepilin-type N-terminal cleavage/methylation domain-containing protein [Phycisphaerae bacterium]